jgi:hypothetical protein
MVGLAHPAMGIPEFVLLCAEGDKSVMLTHFQHFPQKQVCLLCVHTVPSHSHEIRDTAVEVSHHFSAGVHLGCLFACEDAFLPAVGLGLRRLGKTQQGKKESWDDSVNAYNISHIPNVVDPSS